MGDQTVTKAELEGTFVAFTMTINVFTSQAAMLTTSLNNHGNNNNNRNNQNMGGGTIRVPHGRNNRITKYLSFSEVEGTDVENFEYIDKIDDALEKCEIKNKFFVSSSEGKNYWDELLKDRYQEQKVEKQKPWEKGSEAAQHYWGEILLV